MRIQSVFVLAVVAAVFSCASGHAQNEKIIARKGIIDLRNHNFTKQGPVKLDGSWGFSWENLVGPGEWEDSAQQGTIPFPSVWNGHNYNGIELTGQGYATYHLTVLMPELADPDHLLAVGLPDFYCSYNLWINGRQIAANGVVGTSRRESVPQWLPRTVIFSSQRDTLNLLLQVSNFYHARGGANDHIYIGLHDQLLQKRESAVITNILLTGSLILIGAFFVILFFFFSRDKAALYFAAICLTWAVRSVFTNLYLVNSAFPHFDWELAVKIEYLTLYLTMMWSVVFITKIFPQDSNKTVLYILVGLNLIFIGLSMATPASFYTHLLDVYMIVAWTLLAYIAYVVLHALVYSRAGAALVALSILFGVLMFAYDMFTYNDVFDFNPLLFNVGYMIIFLLNATAFAFQLSLSARPRMEKLMEKDVLSYEDLATR